MSQLWELHGSQVGKERNDKYNDKYNGKDKDNIVGDLRISIKFRNILQDSIYPRCAVAFSPTLPWMCFNSAHIIF